MPNDIPRHSCGVRKECIDVTTQSKNFRAHRVSELEMMVEYPDGTWGDVKYKR